MIDKKFWSGEYWEYGFPEKYKGYAYMYAQYPHQKIWSEKNSKDFEIALGKLANFETSEPTLLYVHFPYCPQICNYCSCFKLGTKNYDNVKEYLDYLCQEIDLLKRFNPSIQQIHLGGGSPTYLKTEDFNNIFDKLSSLTPYKNPEEFVLEVDPREVDEEKMKYFASRNINRISLGIQDFDKDVQLAVNRVQPIELVKRILTPEIRRLFSSINFDILHGLPRQTRESFKRTIDTVLELSPDRISLLTFSYSPENHSNQRNIRVEELPNDTERLQMFNDAKNTLLENGYQRVGLEHFVKSTDNLLRFWNEKDINWNIGGYNRGRVNKIIGIGLGSSSRITEDYYFQNTSDLNKYKELISQNKFPIERGYKLSADDKIRRDVVMILRGSLFLDMTLIEQKYHINFKKYFKKEIKELRSFVNDGIITMTEDYIIPTEDGKPFIGFACKVFDKYENEKNK